jgi:hypothetical protein
MGKNRSEVIKSGTSVTRRPLRVNSSARLIATSLLPLAYSPIYASTILAEINHYTSGKQAKQRKTGTASLSCPTFSLLK